MLHVEAYNYKVCSTQCKDNMHTCLWPKETKNVERVIEILDVIGITLGLLPQQFLPLLNE